MPDENRQEQAVGEFWAGLLGSPGTPRPAAGALDPELTETLRRLRAMTQTPPPAGARERLDRDLRPRLAAQQNGQAPDSEHETTIVAIDTGSRRRNMPTSAPFAPPDDIRTRRRWGFAQFAVAALLLLALGAGALAIGRGWWSDTPRRNTVPAAVAPATPTPERTEELLVEIALPADLVPVGINGGALARYSMEPGTETTYKAAQELMLLYIIEGTLNVRPTDPMQVRSARGDGGWETVPAGTAVDLWPGDAAFYPDLTTAGFANAGPAPVEMLSWILTAGTEGGNPTPPYWRDHDVVLSGAGGLDLPGGPATLRLRRVELAGQATFPAAPAHVYQWIVSWSKNPAGTPVLGGVTRHLDGSARNIGDDPAFIYVVTLETSESPLAGSPVSSGP